MSENEKNLRIVSDGTGDRTHIYLDGKEVEHVQRLQITVETGPEPAQVNLELNKSSLDLTAGRYRLTKIVESSRGEVK